MLQKKMTVNKSSNSTLNRPKFESGHLNQLICYVSCILNHYLSDPFSFADKGQDPLTFMYPVPVLIRIRFRILIFLLNKLPVSKR
jgi:hypothetical protein